MKIKANELQGAALDWAVAKSAGNTGNFTIDGYSPSTEWAQGGPIIEREKITIEWTGENWMGYIWHDAEFFGPTPMIAAMRCYVASMLGDEVDVPNQLIK